MKKCLLLFPLFVLSLNTMGFSNEIQKNLDKFDICNPSDSQIIEKNKFLGLLDNLISDEDNGTNIIDIDENFYETTLTNTATKLECKMIIDAYDGRCSTFECNN